MHLSVHVAYSSHLEGANMPDSSESYLCPPHYWEVTSVRIEGICHYHHRCVKCEAQKDVPLSATGTSKWVSRHPKAKTA